MSTRFSRLVLAALAIRAAIFFAALTPLAVNAAPPALQWSSRGVGGGGALFAPSFSPYAAQELWIACDMSELFQTKTLGASWRPVPFRQLQGNRESWVRFTSDPKVLYSLNYAGDVVRPARSGDGGVTWAALANDPTGSEAYGIWADPASTQRLLVAAADRIYFSNTGGSSWSTAYTNSGGVRVAGVFWDGAEIFIGTNAGVVASTNSGANFGAPAQPGIPAAQRIISFAGGRTGSTRRLACSTCTLAISPYDTIDDYMDVATPVYTLDSGASASWQLRTSGLSASHHLPWVGMARNNAEVIWAAGNDGSGSPAVDRSVDGGATWTSVLRTANNANVATGWSGHGGDRGWGYGEYAMGFAVAPTDATKAAFTDFGFCHVTSNGGSSWQQAYVNPADQNPAGALTPAKRSYRSVGLEDTTCWQVFFATSTRAFLCNSDIRGSISNDRGRSWGFDYSGHTDNSMYRIARHADGALYAATSTVHDLYQSTFLQDSRIDSGTGRVLKSTDNGKTWTQLWNAANPVIWVATDPSEPKRLYASLIDSVQGGIWKTETLDAGTGATWTKCPAPPRTQAHPYNIVVLNDGTLVVTFSGKRDTAGAFTTTSGLFVSTDHGDTWADRGHANMQYWTKDVVIDPHDSTQNTWYGCVFNGWGGPPNNKGGVYRTTNRGQNWTQVMSNSNVPSSLANVESLTVHPTTPGTAYATTEVDGLWFTSNLGAATPTWEQVTGYTFRQPTRVFFDPADAGKIWVTSFGHGLSVGMSPWQSWTEESFGSQSTDSTIAGDLADPDRDGANNLVEFSQNSNPLVADARPLAPGGASGLPVLANSTGWRFEFIRRTAASNPGVTYVAEGSATSPTGWQPLTGTPQITPIDDTWERVSWPLPAGGQMFCRLRFVRP